MKSLKNLTNKQLAFIIAFCVMGILVLVIFNIRLQGKQEPEFLFEMALDETQIPEEPEQPVPMTKLETHQAYNEAEKSRYAKEVEQFETLEELTQRLEEAKAAEEASDNGEGLGSETAALAREYIEKLEQQKLQLQKNLKKDDAPVANIKRRTTISYSLVDRNHLSLPNPIYTCESFGTVVINIKVNALGEVVETSFNKKSSTTDNGCLVDNALYYASLARFNANGSRTDQPGTITYQFQGE